MQYYPDAFPKCEEMNMQENCTLTFELVIKNPCSVVHNSYNGAKRARDMQ